MGSAEGDIGKFLGSRNGLFEFSVEAVPMSRVLPTISDIDDLLAFLPLFRQPGRAFIERWVGGPSAKGDLVFPYPAYPADVLEFFRLAGQPCWSDYGYNPRNARATVEDDAAMAKASLQDIRTMLTYCVRGERFGDGHWAAMLESGRVVAILERLQELRDAM